jgi:hypothetical protein
MFISVRENKPSNGFVRTGKNKRYEQHEQSGTERVVNAVPFAVRTPQKKNAA